MRGRVSFIRALSALTASLALTVLVAPTAAAASPARLPAAFHITLPWATGAEPIECAYHGYTYSRACANHKNVAVPGVTNDEYALDFGLKPGTRVLAVASGRVEWAGWCNPSSPSASLRCNGSKTWPKYGNSISIQHYGAGAGFTSFYAHLSKISVKSGQVVKAGQLIGYSGETGTEGGPHLHFALYFNAGGAYTLHTPTASPPYGGVAAIPEPFSNCTKADGSSCIDLRVGDSLVPGGAASSPAPSGPTVTGVDVSWLSGQNASFTIHGSGFGTMSPYDGDDSHLRIEEASGMWGAGWSGDGDAVHVDVTSWTDNSITVANLSGMYGQNGWVLHPGDSMHVLAWNAQSGAGPTLFSFTMPAAPTNTPPTVVPPAAPTNVTATAVSSTCVEVTWTDNSGGQAGYYVSRAGPTTELVSAGGTSYEDCGLAPGTTYSYTVVAYNAAGTSWALNGAWVTPPAAAVITSPYIGDWVNVLEPAPRSCTVGGLCVGITHINILGDPGGLSVHPWGNCSPTDCDWGIQVVSLTSIGANGFQVTWNPGFAIESQHYVLNPDGSLTVSTSTHFTDGSGRRDYTMTEQFKRG
jgi:murein DD-endopeptidase MepM/ murein hydrolase activator NlpD